MKNLISSTAKVFKLSFVIVALASAPVLAGGNEDGKANKNANTNAAYALALNDMEKALNETKDSESIYAPAPQVKIYDSNFNLIQQANIPEDGIVEDKELLKLMRQSSELMKLDHITYYVMNN